MLEDTTLCAIVRDEMVNPAGGIADFVESTVPNVERAVIVDTGSVDGTLEALRALEGTYPHLCVLEREFDDFAACRNYSLAQATTRWVLVLDADERMAAEDIEGIAAWRPGNPASSYCFTYVERYADGTVERVETASNPRMFERTDNVTYENLIGKRAEVLMHKKWQGMSYWRVAYGGMVTAPFTITHHLTTKAARARKEIDWYEAIVDHGRDLAPSQVPSFRSWKRADAHTEAARTMPTADDAREILRFLRQARKAR